MGDSGSPWHFGRKVLPFAAHAP